MFEGRFNRLKEERENLRRAKEALELSQPDQMTGSDERMQVGQEELQDLKVSGCNHSLIVLVGSYLSYMFICLIRVCGQSWPRSGTRLMR